jgi:hypothetical protein
VAAVVASATSAAAGPVVSPVGAPVARAARPVARVLAPVTMVAAPVTRPGGAADAPRRAVRVRQGARTAAPVASGAVVAVVDAKQSPVPVPAAAAAAQTAGPVGSSGARVTRVNASPAGSLPRGHRVRWWVPRGPAWRVGPAVGAIVARRSLGGPTIVFARSARPGVGVVGVAPRGTVDEPSGVAGPVTPLPGVPGGVVRGALVVIVLLALAIAGVRAWPPGLRDRFRLPATLGPSAVWGSPLERPG